MDDIPPDGYNNQNNYADNVYGHEVDPVMFLQEVCDRMASIDEKLERIANALEGLYDRLDQKQ